MFSRSNKFGSPDSLILHKRHQDIESKIDGRLFLGIKVTNGRTENNHTKLKKLIKRGRKKKEAENWVNESRNTYTYLIDEEIQV